CAAVAQGRGISTPAQKTIEAKYILEAVAQVGRRVTVLVDGLDEAKPGHAEAIALNMLRPLARLPGVPFLVGTRRGPDGSTIPAGEDRHSRLHRLFGDEAIIRDLDDEDTTQNDIDEDVRPRLPHSPRPRHDLEGVTRAARLVAERAGGSFLYARIVSRTLQDLERLDGELPRTALEAFVADLQRRFGERAELVDELLAILAWGEGKGLTRRVWAPV